MFFEWDPTKASSNRRKHGVSFDEARTVFGDPNALTFDDPDHSEDEDRVITIGLSSHQRLIFVSHVYKGEEFVRIIMARKATARERVQYAEIT